MTEPKRKEVVNEIIRLWNEYCKSREGREANVPDGLPVFNATNFIYWLVNEYSKKREQKIIKKIQKMKKTNTWI